MNGVIETDTQNMCVEIGLLVKGLSFVRQPEGTTVVASVMTPQTGRRH